MVVFLSFALLWVTDYFPFSGKLDAKSRLAKDIY